MSDTNILVVDDDPKLRRLLSINLSSLDYVVTCAVDGSSALALFNHQEPDLVLLDVMMPKLDGFAVLEKMRRTSQVPIILLTAKDQVEDKVKGFDLGADDYLAKPFALEELFGRVRAVLRRTNKGDELKQEPDCISNGILRLNLSEKRVWVGDAEVRLTVNEYNLLKFFARHVNSVVMHEQLFAHVWGIGRELDMQVLRVTLGRMRQKLREAGLCDDCGIESYSGIGYRMRNL